MKQTALTKTHISLGAKMAEFAGYNMPISYNSINEEHYCVRNSVGVFDVSHMGEFLISGNGALELVQKVTSNNVRNLIPGKAQYSCLPNNSGGIIDDLIVYCLKENEFLLVVNASNIEKDWDWISSQNSANVLMKNISHELSLLAVQGPKAINALQGLTNVNLSEIPFYNFTKGDFCGEKDVIISATGYTGAGGFELYIPNKSAQKIWDKIFQAGQEFGIQAIGLGARDTLRLEMGYCLYGNDINDHTSPLEAGLGWITKLKSDNFIGKEQIIALKEKGIKKKLMPIEAIDKGAIPRNGYPVFDLEGKKIGEVTSGTLSPTTKKAIGLAYVDIAHACEGTEIQLGVRKRLKRAKISKLPFIPQ